MVSLPFLKDVLSLPRVAKTGQWPNSRYERGRSGMGWMRQAEMRCAAPEGCPRS